MAYNVEKLTKLSALKQLAQREKSELDKVDGKVTALSEKVDGLVTAGGEPNVITAIKVNGEAQAITDKAVDLTVPAKVSELTNDSKFQTDADVSAAIQAAVAETGHAIFEKVEAVPSADAAKDNVLYLVMNDQTKHYDIYAKVGEEVVLLDDTTVDLSGYDTAEQTGEKLAGKVDKEEGKGLSSNDFTDELKAKLESSPEVAGDAEVAEMLAEVFGATA